MFTTRNLEKYNTSIASSSASSSRSTSTNGSRSTSSTRTSTNKTPIMKKDDVFSPRQTDTLFWCFYLIKYGEAAYETICIEKQHFIKEKDEKFKYIDIIRKHKDILKANKIRPLSDVEDDLANKDKITLKTFLALCLIEKLNVIIINKRKIFESINSDSEVVFLVNKVLEQDKYYIDLAVTNEKIAIYRKEYYNLESFEPSLKAMSSYKLDELYELATKLGVELITPTDKKKLCKKDIYEQLVQQF
jgi:hypothetical protein